MTEFFETLSDKSTMKKPATRMEKEDNMLLVYYEEDLVAAVDISMVLCADIHPMKSWGREVEDGQLQCRA